MGGYFRFAINESRFDRPQKIRLNPQRPEICQPGAVMMLLIHWRKIASSFLGSSTRNARSKLSAFESMAQRLVTKTFRIEATTVMTRGAVQSIEFAPLKLAPFAAPKKQTESGVDEENLKVLSGSNLSW